MDRQTDTYIYGGWAGREHSFIDNGSINMQLIIISALVAVCSAGALPQSYLAPYTRTAPTYYQDRPRALLERSAAILRSTAEVNEQGYQFAYDTENGIRAEEQGQEADGIQAQGGYSYTGDDGQVYSVRYTAGSNGFQAEGAHIPTPPPVPEAIAKALQENARDEAAGIFDDGSYHDGKYDSGVVVARRYNPTQYLAPAVRAQARYPY